MELNYYQKLFSLLNQEYLVLRMEADLPWSIDAKQFLKQNHNLKNFAEAWQMTTYLTEVDKDLKTSKNLYSNQLQQTFNQQQTNFLLEKGLLLKLHQEFKAWTIRYNDENLLHFNKLLFTTFQNKLDYLLLKYQGFFLEHQNEPLTKYLISLQASLEDQSSNGVEWMTKISEFYFKMNESLQEMKQQNQLSTTMGEEIYLFLTSFGQEMKLWLFLYYSWLLNNQVMDFNTAKFANLYIQ